MPRQPRRQEPGMVKHVIIRGNRRQDIFREECDWSRFWKGLLEVGLNGMELLGACLMVNHAHLLVRCGVVAIGSHLQGLLTSHAHYFNRKYGHAGHLFQGRYIDVESPTDEILKHQLRYTHRNPVRAGLVAKAGDWRWTSHHSYAGAPEPGIHTDFILNMFSPDRPRAIELYKHFMEDAPAEPPTPDGDLPRLATHMERAEGFESGVIAGPRRTAVIADLRARFIVLAVASATVSEVAAFLHRTEAAVYASLAGKRGVI